MGKLSRKPESASSVDSCSSFPCPGCAALLEDGEIAAFLRVCPGCGHHFPLTAWERVTQLAGESGFLEWDKGLGSHDPIGFVDQLSYQQRLERAARKTGMREAVLTGLAKVGGQAAALGVFDFRFMGGSMGSAVGEKLARLFGRAVQRGLPVVLVIASGGARMQEGCYSLMQMAKVTAAVARFKCRSVPYLAVLTNPTTGGVAASVAFQADLLLAEPGAQIGFAGRRVIAETIGARLPAEVQRAEFLRARGFIDAVIPRPQLVPTVSRILSLLDGGRALAGGGGEGRPAKR